MPEGRNSAWNAGSLSSALLVAAVSCITAFVVCFRLEILTGDYLVANVGQWSDPEDIVIVTIDEDTLATLAYRSPIDRAFLAKIVGKIDQAKPRAIGIDLLIDQPSEPEKDKNFIKTLEALKAPLYVGYGAGSDGLSEKQMAYENASLKNVKKALVTLSRDDFDGTIRQVFTGRLVDGTWYPGLAAALAEVAGHMKPHPIGRSTYFSDTKGEPFEFPAYPAHTVNFIPLKWFEDKIVLIGTALPTADRHSTPFSSLHGARVGDLFGVTIHAHMLAQMMSGDRILAPGMVLTILTVLGLTLLASLLVISRFPPLLRLTMVLLVIITFCLAAYTLFRLWQIQIPVTTSVVAATLSSVFLALGQWYQDREQRQFIEKAFSKYVSPAVVKKIVANRKALVLGGETRMVTYVFTDIEGFTSLCEGMKPDEVAPLLNDYLDRMCTLFVEADATIDKIIGDAVVGFFGAPESQDDQTERAVGLALAIDNFSQDYCKSQRVKGIKLGITRIGVHCGNAVIGNFGGSRFMDYTGIGDTVNTAARLEAANKHFGTRICVSRKVRDNSRNHVFRPIGSILLKGKDEPVDCFLPVDPQLSSEPMLAAYLEAFQSMTDDAKVAGKAFSRLAKSYPDDPLIALHHARLQQGDNGVTITLTEK